MISFIKGKMVFKAPTHVVIETTGGVGYHVHISLYTYSQLKDEEQCKLHTYLSIKEDAHTLYGFYEEGERLLFKHLISVSGIGPGTARMMLSSITPQEIQQAIVQGNVPMVQRIKGIGPKSAQRLVLELQDKLKKEGLDSLISTPLNNTAKDEALSALMMLGFSKQVAEKALDTIQKIEGDNLPVEQLIKLALKSI